MVTVTSGVVTVIMSDSDCDNEEMTMIKPKGVVPVKLPIVRAQYSDSMDSIVNG